MLPPTVLTLSPTDIKMLPPAPPSAFPVVSDKDPLEPLLALPLPIFMFPLLPDAPDVRRFDEYFGDLRLV